jgi:hypothetical protein
MSIMSQDAVYKVSVEIAAICDLCTLYSIINEKTMLNFQRTFHWYLCKSNHNIRPISPLGLHFPSVQNLLRFPHLPRAFYISHGIHPLFIYPPQQH